MSELIPLPIPPELVWNHSKWFTPAERVLQKGPRKHYVDIYRENELKVMAELNKDMDQGPTNSNGVPTGYDRQLIYPVKKAWHDIPIVPGIHMVKLITSDKKTIWVNRKVMAMSETMKSNFRRMGRLNAKEPIILNNINAHTLQTIIKYCQHCYNDVIQPEKTGEHSSDEEVPEDMRWDYEGEPEIFYVFNRKVTFGTKKEELEKEEPKKEEPKTDETEITEKPESDKPKSKKQLKLEKKKAEKLEKQKEEEEKWQEHRERIVKATRLRRYKFSRWEWQFLEECRGNIIDLMKAGKELEIDSLREKLYRYLAQRIKLKMLMDIPIHIDIIKNAFVTGELVKLWDMFDDLDYHEELHRTLLR